MCIRDTSRAVSPTSRAPRRPCNEVGVGERHDLGPPLPSPVPTLNGVELALIYRLLHPQARRPRRSVVMQSITTKIASRLASQAMATGPRPRAGPGAGAPAPPKSPTWLAHGRPVPRLTATTARVPMSTADSSITSSVTRARSGVARAGSGLGAATLGLVTGTTLPGTAAGRAALGGLGPCGARSRSAARSDDLARDHDGSCPGDPTTVALAGRARPARAWPIATNPRVELGRQVRRWFCLL